MLESTKVVTQKKTKNPDNIVSNSQSLTAVHSKVTALEGY